MLAKDASGNGNDGTYPGSGVTYGAAGLVGGDSAVSGDSTISGGVVTAAPTSVDISADSCWINVWVDPLPTTANSQLVALRTAGLANNFTFQIEQPSAGTLRMRVNWSSPFGVGGETVTDSVSAGSHMYTVVYDASVPEVQFYLDGSLFGSAQVVPGPSFPQGPSVSALIGDPVDQTVTYDEISFGDGAPDATDIAGLFTAASVSFAAYTAAVLALSPVNYYHLNERLAGWHVGRIAVG